MTTRLHLLAVVALFCLAAVPAHAANEGPAVVSSFEVAPEQPSDKASYVGGTEDSTGSYPIMRPDRETIMKWIESYRRATSTPVDKTLTFSSRSMSLLSHLPYNPDERNQGACGNCWAWAGAGALEIAMDVQSGILDRLSVQHLNSCEYSVIGKECCEGGWLEDLADFYTARGAAIPWSNAGANWQDADASCDTGCSSLAVTPQYPIAFIEAHRVDTQGVGQAAAIANIKNALDHEKAVWLGFFLPTDSEWAAFYSFWDDEPETAVWSPNASCGQPVNPGELGGHAVLIVGYNDEDPNPDDHYWLAVNSWGTAGGGRPNGLFRVAMNLDYDCMIHDEPYQYYSLYWETLEVDFGAVLWQQPVSIVDTDLYACQDFEEVNDGFDIFIADDFTLEETKNIGQIYVPGGLWNNGTTLDNASRFTWEVYADFGGKPDGDPAGGGNPPLWRLSVPSSDSRVEITNGSGGFPSNVTVNLNPPVRLSPGTYWLVFYPELDFGAGYGQYGRLVSDTTNGHTAQVINPGGGHGFPSVWSNVTDVPWASGTLTQQDFAFSLMGEGGPPPLGKTLAVDFGENGLCLYHADWGWVTCFPFDVQYLAAFEGGLAMDLGPYGLYATDGVTFNQVLGGNPDNSGNTMVGYGSMLAVDLGYLGFYVCDPMTPPEPSDNVWWANVEYICPYGGDKLALDVGSGGLWTYDGADRTQLTMGNPTNNESTMVALGSGLAVSFNHYPLYYEAPGVWEYLFSYPVQFMCAYGDNSIAFDVGGLGVWSYDGSDWAQLSPYDADNTGNTMVAYGTGLAVDLGEYGLYYLNKGVAERLLWVNPEHVCAFQGGLAVDLGMYGLWLYDGEGWILLAGWDPDNTGNTMISTGFLD